MNPDEIDKGVLYVEEGDNIYICTLSDVCFSIHNVDAVWFFTVKDLESGDTIYEELLDIEPLQFGLEYTLGLYIGAYTITSRE